MFDDVVRVSGRMSMIGALSPTGQEGEGGSNGVSRAADLQLLSTAMKSRREVMKVAKHSLKADLPLSVADLPLLVSLIRSEVQREGTKRRAAQGNGEGDYGAGGHGSGSGHERGTVRDRDRDGEGQQANAHWGGVEDAVMAAATAPAQGRWANVTRVRGVTPL